MNFVSWNISGIGKALLPAVMLAPRIAEHRNASADSARQKAAKEAAPNRTEVDVMSVTACRGQEIRRPFPTKDAARWFVQELQSREIVGERTWKALWDCYIWFCEEAEIVPLSETMKGRFAKELRNLCRRGQVRVREGGKVRRLTTYSIPNVKPTYLRRAA